MENRPNEPTRPDPNVVNPADVPPNPVDIPPSSEHAGTAPPPIETHTTPPPPLSQAPPVSETPPLYGSAQQGGVPPLTPVARNKEEQNWALGAHLSTLSNYVGLPGFIGPLVIYLIKKDTMPFAAEQAREALNFQISLFIYVIGCLLLFFLVLPLFFIPVIAVVHIVFTILASLSVGEGKAYRYPLTLRLVQ